MTKAKAAIFYILICIMLPSTGLSAAGYETLDHINSLASEYVSKNVSVDPDEKIEIRLSEAAADLRLAACTLPIAVNLPDHSTSQHITTLEMTCAGNPSWHVYIPVDMKVLTKVVTARENIASKTEIKPDMVELTYRDKNTLYNGYYKDPSEVDGKEPVMTIVPGTVLTSRNTRDPIIINRNQAVSIISGHGHIMVRADGIAKTSGALHDIIKVLNPSSKKVLDAVVVNSSTVEVIAS